jgi:anti-sigma factor RsiW
LVEHLTQKQFEGYRRRQLEVAELLSVCDHLGVCEACRLRAEGAGEGDAAFFALRADIFGVTAEDASSDGMRAHLTAEQTAGYVDGTLSGDALRTASDHLSSCEHCALSVEDLRAFKDMVAPSLEHEYKPAAALSTPALPSTNGERWRRTFASLPALFRVSPVPAFGAALAVLLLALFGWLNWRTTREGAPSREVVVSPSTAPQPAPVVVPPTPSESEPEPTPTQPEPAPAFAQLNDGGGRLTLDREGELSGADALPPAYRKLLKEALAGRRIERSSQLRGLSRPGSSLMGSETEGGEFSVFDPAGGVLLTGRPTFRWSTLDGATGYVVEVYDDAFKLVAASPQLNARSWASSQTLPRGKVYSWQVKALKDGQEFKTPRPPAPQAKFRVLDRAKADELARAKRAYPTSHLTLGLLYADAGLLKEAEQELRLLQRANPDSELARGLLRQIQALRRRNE